MFILVGNDRYYYDLRFEEQYIKKIASLTARERETEKPWQNKMQTTASHSADFLLPVAESTKDKSNADKSFMRSWSRSDGQMANTLRSSTNSAPTPETTPAFERGKYKSDGEGIDQFCSELCGNSVKIMCGW